RYMDGGVRSATNADLARGDERILILNPLGANATLFGTGSAKEAAALAGRLSEPVSAMEKRRAPLLADVRSPLESQDPSGER
ncbi:MAG TPA: hypothetical protein VFV38_30050, partial [Ktedonobacteraceae bacterium]|nr:hypothetical protein [Ktedonobacteraceae bacterium]